MIPQLKRHEIQVLLKAGHTQEQTASIAAVFLRTVQRVSEKPAVQQVDATLEDVRKRLLLPDTGILDRGLVARLLPRVNEAAQ